MNKLHLPMVSDHSALIRAYSEKAPETPSRVSGSSLVDASCHQRDVHGYCCDIKEMQTKRALSFRILLAILGISL